MYLLPRPQQEEWYGECYTIRYNGCIVTEETGGVDCYPYMKMLQEEVEEDTGIRLKLRQGSSKKADITLRIDALTEPEGYTLTVSQKGIWMSAGGRAGMIYGIQTLRQIIRQGGACIPCLKISDYPCFPVRGLFYDVTRGRIPTLDYLKKLADHMVFYKMNQLQLYIEHSFLFENLSEVWRDDTPLTAEDILELDRYCRGRGIELVPAIASFGHLYKILRTKSFRHLCEMPELAEKPFGFVDRMNHHTLDVSNPDSLYFIKGLMEEYMELFSSHKFNICADETFDLGKGGSRKLAKEKGVHRLYVDFIKELCTFLKEHNRQPMFWGDIISECPELLEGTARRHDMFKLGIWGGRKRGISAQDCRGRGGAVLLSGRERLEPAGQPDRCILSEYKTDVPLCKGVWGSRHTEYGLGGLRARQSSGFRHHRDDLWRSFFMGK